MEPFFDLFVTSLSDLKSLPPVKRGEEPDPDEDVIGLPEGLRGAMFHGDDAGLVCERLERIYPRILWHHGEPVHSIISAENARFPPATAGVINVIMSPKEWRQRLEDPAKWWPLCDSIRQTNRFLRLVLPTQEAGWASLWTLIKRLVRFFPETKFLLDPFSAGPVTGWQGGVRQAEYEHVLLTTYGLFGGSPIPWTNEDIDEALLFTSGEVGASALLYASGQAWENWIIGADLFYRKILRETKALDSIEKQLVLYLNAEEYLADVFADLEDFELDW